MNKDLGIMAKNSICSVLIFFFTGSVFASPTVRTFVGASQASEMYSILNKIDNGGLVISRTGGGHFFFEVDLNEIVCNEDLSPALISSPARNVECSIVISRFVLGTSTDRTEVLDDKISIALKDALAHMGAVGVAVSNKETFEAREILCTFKTQLDRSLTPECTLTANWK
jgi:hypothetical protein